MVLYKRKPITRHENPTNLSNDTQIWVVRDTNEIFVDYDKYLKRIDYFMQKKFVDAVNGKSGLTFFDALQSENKSITAVENVFPEVLRGPILRKVQFSTILRIDDLVTAVHEEFKRDFFPGEDVFCYIDNDPEPVEGAVREKAKFPMIRGPGGEVEREAFSRYFVRLHRNDDEECLVDDKHLRRARRVFTKQNIRAFLKHSLQREGWLGAPWLVKEPLAIQYRLPMEIPSHLLQEAQMLANKHILQQKKGRPRAQNFAQQAEYERMKQEEIAHRQMLQQQHPGATPQQLQQMQNSRQTAISTKPPPPPTIKYPIEDLDLAPKRNGITRPKLSFFTEEMAEYVTTNRKLQLRDVELDSMGMLLEIWNTLNVQCEVYVLDSFTFDDFVDAMRFQSAETRCELLEEVHCAVLKLLVDDKGKITVAKSALPQSNAIGSNEESDATPDTSAASTPLPDVPANSTRSSRLSHVDPTTEHPRNSTGPIEKTNRATAMLDGRSWVDRLAARDFENGGWQVILVGLLQQLTTSPVWKTRADRVLAWLAPVDLDATQETARFQYANMDINLRTSALQIITMLSVATPAIKEFLDACSEDMTDVRKRKIEHQRSKKLAMEELAIKDRERKILLPDNMLPDSPKEESLEPASTNGDAEDSIELTGITSSDPEDDAPTTGRSLRRGNDRKRKREEEAARVAEEKKKAELAKQQPKQSREFRKILSDIEELNVQIAEHEAKISECDADLREANVQRTKVLGRDRYCNRYYWFERNGQPFGGLPRSSTAHHGYANGRIWVQGPDDLEMSGYIGDKEQQRDYELHFGITIPQRRDLEEGQTVLQSSREWGYYDNPEALDNLITWLDDRGEREKALRRELVLWRDVIMQYMQVHKKFMDDDAAKKIEAEEEHHGARIFTRNKTHDDRVAARERCLKWTNTMAMDEIGHLHSQPSRQRPKQKVTLRHHPQQKGIAVPVNRHGKPVTRQGI